MRRLAVLLLPLALLACKQDCTTLCQQQLGCAVHADPDASVLIGPRCDELCASGEYRETDACQSCLDSHGLCLPTAHGGYAYQGCESVCPQIAP